MIGKYESGSRIRRIAVRAERLRGFRRDLRCIRAYADFGQALRRSVA